MAGCHSQDREGGLARALDTYAFGESLMWLCYGIARTPIWDKVAEVVSPAVNCRTGIEGLDPIPKKTLHLLVMGHLAAHPRGRTAPAPNALNRCTKEYQEPLDELMEATWRPLVEAWNATRVGKTRGGRTTYKFHHGRAISSATDFGMLWDQVEAKLSSMGHGFSGLESKSFFRFNVDD